MSNTPKLSRLVWGTLRFNLIRTAWIRTTRSQDPWNNDTWTFLVLKTWRQTSLDSYEALYDSTRFARSHISYKYTSGMTNQQQGKQFVSIQSNRQYSQLTLHSPPEVKIREIKIHEPSLFLKRGNKLQSIRMTRVDLIESSRIDNILNPPYIVQGRCIF